MSTSPTIAALIVTRNRLDLLEQCVCRVRMQSLKPDAIVVVNNGSTDGTRAWLDQQTDLQVLHQENLGGAGGFHNGMRHAYDAGYDLVWCMDDDVDPHAQALEHLMQAYHSFPDPQHSVLNSVVLLPGSSDHLAWGMFVKDNRWLKPTGRAYDSLSVLRKDYPDGIFPNYGCFFNATLIPRTIIKAIGYPKSEFFMKGDEFEYCLRVVRSFRLATVLGSVVFHPLIQGKVPAWRFYLTARNMEAVNHHYYPCFRNSKCGLLLRLLRLSAKTCVSPSEAKRMEWLGMWDALWGYYGRNIHELIRSSEPSG
jgi:rhamnopyranosyl-N-acetylglucosaminyl-diphospho-decaprenol beta-1,3/1,4-galactofuranosyltransferase